uniref:Uncharacterized protein n=1 Tax=Meloidogyne javanica TaxID=6303 RepID=A0A915N312_MELJA
MDESFGIGALLREEQLKKLKKKRGGNVETEPSSGGLIVGHSVQDFQEGRETILVLEDKSLLLDGEDADEEILINPNMVENERTKLNVERRKKKATHYQAYEEEEIDEFGQIKRKEILDKYNEGMDGENKKKETFRLDETGHYDLDKEAKEAEAKRKLMMVNKKFESLGETKYTLANEFYTEEEVIQFRRLKKKKTSKNSRKKALKTAELEPLEETEEEKKIREEKLAARRREQQESGEEGGGKSFRDTMKESSNNGSSKVVRSVVMEEGEIVESKKEIKQSKDSIAMPPPDQTKWKKPKVNVDVKMLDIFAERIKKGEEEEDDEEEFLPTNVAPIQIEDDDASEELNAILAKARLLKNSEKMVKKEVTYFASDSSDDEDMEEQKNSNAIIFDATSEKYKAIGGGGYGNDQQINKKVVKTEMEEEMEIGSEIASSSLKKEFLKRRRTDSGSSQEFERMDEERDGERSDSDEATKNYSNILGEEKDVTKGVAAMLKLAGQKGYLESGNKKRHGEGRARTL